MEIIRTGVRKILEFSVIFKLFKKAIGGSVAQKRLVDEFIRPFPRAKILDIGCGLGSNLDDLPDDIEYFGYDMNARYIAHAKKKYNGRGQFFCSRVSDASSLVLESQFDIVMAISILHHLDDHEAKSMFKNAYSLLSGGGVLITFDGVYIPGQSALARYIISKDRGRHVRTPGQYDALARAYFPYIETTILHDMLWIPYTHIIMRCSKQKPGTPGGMNI